MRKADPKRIMVCVDGSEHAMAAVKYVGDILDFRDLDVVLFHVMRKLDDAFLDMGINPAYRKRVAEVGAWEVEQEKEIKDGMEKYRRILLDAGAPAGSLKTDVRWKKVGVSRDIIREAEKGYDAVVVGRKGLSRLKDLLLGSVAQKLVQKLGHTPVWVTGESPGVSKVLLAFDGSEGAGKAVVCAGSFLGTDVQVTLLHVMPGMKSIQLLTPGYIPYEAEQSLEKKWLEETKADMWPQFDKAKSQLVNSGLSPHKIDFEVITGASSRAGAILEEAEKGGYGTIVMGRRGLSRVAEFFMGRVSSKVLNSAKGPAVWIVS
ncbi:MAG: universal stress protein [Deltaproteobacteria bacterium]|nr:universal stress protein [Deltaproteobacteria bacterium]